MSAAPHRVVLSGEVSITGAAAIREKLLAALGRAADIEVDLSQVTEIDSAGVQLMIAAAREAVIHGTTLHFAGHSPAVLDSLQLTGLSPRFGEPQA